MEKGDVTYAHANLMAVVELFAHVVRSQTWVRVWDEVIHSLYKNTHECFLQTLTLVVARLV